MIKKRYEIGSLLPLYFEILFRGKRLDDGQWVYGSLVQMLINGRIASCICPIEEVGRGNKDVPPMGILHTLNENIFLVDQATICQYTGLKDKNGMNEIFSGDICNFKYIPNPTYNNPNEYLVTAVVEWSKRNYGYCLHNVNPRSKNHPSRKQYFQLGDYRIVGLTIVGNKWDNPELLKG